MPDRSTFLLGIVWVSLLMENRYSLAFKRMMRLTHHLRCLPIAMGRQRGHILRPRIEMASCQRSRLRGTLSCNGEPCYNQDSLKICIAIDSPMMYNEIVNSAIECGGCIWFLFEMPRSSEKSGGLHRRLQGILSKRTLKVVKTAFKEYVRK